MSTKKWQANWVQKNPFEGNKVHKAKKVVELDSAVTKEQVEEMAKAITPPRGMVFRDVHEVPMDTPVSPDKSQ